MNDSRAKLEIRKSALSELLKLKRARDAVGARIDNYEEEYEDVTTEALMIKYSEINQRINYYVSLLQNGEGH